jgi:hypothetical protein
MKPLTKIASAEHEISLRDANFYDTFQNILAFFDSEKFNYSEIFEVVESLECADFDSSELKNTKAIVSKW